MQFIAKEMQMLNLNEVHFGDCIDLMKYIPDKSVDMVLCDLPYGNKVCPWDVIIPFDALWVQYNRIAKDNAAICLFGQEPFASLLRISNIKNYKYDWYWQKERLTNVFQVKRRPGKVIETISVFYKNQCKYNVQKSEHLGPKRTNKIGEDARWSVTMAGNKAKSKPLEYLDDMTRHPLQIIALKRDNNRKALHPTQKPVALCEFLIKTYTDERAMVLANCSGRGSTGIASMNLKRNFILIEKDEVHFETCKNRLKAQAEVAF